ncbi:YbaB/EbfC family DNA-binding protein [Paraburkholderia caffeinilytica]|uniref:YbaB/EbfC family DNA-binding protein n=1 Tax=Paraburkholderia caffeinilytica TaxID=1761016 RepID=UPI003DA0AF5B
MTGTKTLALGGLLGLIACMTPVLSVTGIPLAHAQAAPSEVPQPWISYAQLVGRQFQAWLEADDDEANQLHQFLEDRILSAKGDAPPPAIVIRAWIAADGKVTDVAFDSLGDPKANALLRQLLTSHPITEPPPPDMRQPLRVRLRMKATTDDAASLPCLAAHCLPAS